jgi:hypothetical protein
VLKNRETNKELFVVVISLLPTDQAMKEGAGGAKEEEAHTGGADDDLD